MKAMLKVFENEHFDIFISHSHKDFQVAVNLAGWLYDTFGLKCFIDAVYWQNIQDLIAPEYKCNPFAIKSASIILTTALTEMIRSCKCLLLLNTPNVAIEDITKSPWIFHEIYTTKVLNEARYSNIYDMSKNFAITDKMDFELDLTNMPILQKKILQVGNIYIIIVFLGIAGWLPSGH